MPEMTETPSKLNVRIPILFAVVMAAGMFVGTKLPVYDRHFARLEGGSLGGGKGSLEELIGYIDARYVDTANTETLRRRAINEFLKGLDPHSVYISKDEIEGVREDMDGKFDGIGIEFLIVDDTLQVVTPLAGGPSEAAGILAGDRVVTINDTLVAGIKIDNALIFKKLRGKKGTIVKVGIRRGREMSLRQFEIRRDAIPIHSVDVAYLLDPTTVYVKINKFSATTAKDFYEKTKPLFEGNKQLDLVLDLRGNPGGYLEQATEILSNFFEQDKLLVYTEGRMDRRQEYKSTGRQNFQLGNIVVLIDEGSASASEIMAGAVQDHDRGWLVGRRSFGKGLVQEEYPLRDGGAVRLTVARYFTPSGRCIQKDYVHDRDHYRDDFENRFKSGELTDGSKVKIADSTAYYTAKGRKVFAGGGIIPDVFVPVDTSFANDYFFDVRSGALAPFAQKMIERQQVAHSGSLEDFVKNYQPGPAVIDELVAYSEKNGIKKNPAQLARCRSELSLELKARLGKLLFKEVGMFSVLNADDAAVRRAMEVLKKGGPGK